MGKLGVFQSVPDAGDRFLFSLCSCNLQEEQKVIEAQIRMRQQELQDAEERMQKRHDLSSSSRIMNAGEVEYQDVANSSGWLLQLFWEFSSFFFIYHMTHRSTYGA